MNFQEGNQPKELKVYQEIGTNRIYTIDENGNRVILQAEGGGSRFVEEPLDIPITLQRSSSSVFYTIPVAKAFSLTDFHLKLNIASSAEISRSFSGTINFEPFLLSNVNTVVQCFITSRSASLPSTTLGNGIYYIEVFIGYDVSKENFIFSISSAKSTGVSSILAIDGDSTIKYAQSGFDVTFGGVDYWTKE